MAGVDQASIRRRSVMMMLAGAAVAPALAGCVREGGQPTQEPAVEASGPIEGTVEFWTINLRKNFQEYFDTLISDFESQHDGVKVNWVDVPGEDMTAKYLSAIASNKVPDVINVDSKNLGQLDATLADHDALWSDEDLTAFQPGLVEGLRVGSTLKGIPWYNSGTRVMMYRKSIMEEAGFTVDQAPTTWQEALELADKVHEATGVYGTNTDPGSLQLLALGVEFVNDELTEAIFNTDEAAGFVELFQEAYASGAIAPGASAPDGKEPQTIDNAQIAFKSAGPGAFTSLEKNTPKAYEDLLVTEAPKTIDGKNQMTGQMALSIPAQSSNMAGAKAFLDHVASAQAQLEFCKLVAIFPSTVATLEDPLFADNPGETPTEQARKIVVDGFPDAVDTTIPLPAGIPNQLRTDFTLAMKETMRSGADAKSSLDAQQKTWQDALDKANKS
ncbi:MAG TPA: extracellular solute-binding protein [Candidatus Avipropionibacterium avicola]|uniref:Extracellular solute-binding protein n=1 Tax=Candidatus Avipropionibacterium avicola TaxID=2840701 RepID=A0A9D1GZ16_9ACTN|nr:extracellular solute-binding protein [Candidatus Avipropionibacterium avicola]